MLSQTASAENPWNPWSQVGLFGSNDLDRAEVEAFLPWGTETTLGFLNVRGNFLTDDFDDLEMEGNFALGARHMLGNGVNLGLWAGTDVRELESHNIFWQLSGGIEVLHDAFDFRANGYAPVTDSKRARSGSAGVTVAGGTVVMSGGREVPMSGYDAELGARVPVESFGMDRDRHELRAFVGGFHFFDDEAARDLAGPKTRLQYQLLDALPGLPGSRLVVHGGMRWDDVRDDHWEGGIQLRFPLSWGGTPNKPIATAEARQTRRMLEPIVRDVDIVSSGSGRESVRDALTDVPFERVVEVTAGADTITNVSTAAGDNSLVVAHGDFVGTQTLEGAQTLLGGGEAIQVRGSESGVVAYLVAPGAGASLTESGAAEVLVLGGTRNHVSGLSLFGGGGRSTQLADNTGIFAGNGPFSGAFTNLELEDLGRNGIDVDSGGSDTSVVFRDVDIENANNNGINVGGDRFDASFQDVEVRNVGAAGFRLHGDGNGDMRVDFDRISVADTGRAGLQVTGGAFGSVGSVRADFRNVDVTDAGRESISVITNGVEVDVFMEDLVLRDSGRQGIDIRHDGGTVRLNRVDIDGNSVAEGISIGARGDSVSELTNVSVSDVAWDGILFGDAPGEAFDHSIRIDNVSLTDIGRTGIAFHGFDGDASVVIHDANLTGIGREGIKLFNDDGAFVTDLRNVSIEHAAPSSFVGIRIGGEGAGSESHRWQDVSISGGFGTGVEIRSDSTGAADFLLQRVEITDVSRDDAILIDRIGPSAVVLNDVTILGEVGNGDPGDVLVDVFDSGPVELNGDVTNQTTNGAPLCRGTFDGTVDFQGVDAQTITDGNGCVP